MSKHQTIWDRGMALMLALVLVLGMLPGAALASDGEPEEVPPAVHTITVAEAEHGTVSADLETAAPGEPVTLTAAPEEGHQLEALSCAYTTEEDGGVQESVEAGPDGRYVFSMPEADVTVSAVFSPLPSGPDEAPEPEDEDEAAPASDDGIALMAAGFFLSLDITGSGSAAVAADGGELTEHGSTGMYRVLAGQDITVTPQADQGHALSSVSYSADGGDTVTALDGDYTFPMPESNVDLYVVFDAERAITVVPSEDVTVTVAEKAVTGSTVTMTAKPLNSHRLTSLTINGEELVSEISNEEQTFTFTMPGQDVTIAAETAAYWEDVYDRSFYEQWKGGTEAGDVMEIDTPEKLAAFGKLITDSYGTVPVNFGGSGQITYYAGTARLTEDIDLSGKLWTPIGYDLSGWVGDRDCNLDGNGKTISGMEVVGGDSAGLFGTAYLGTIQDLTVEGTIEITDETREAGGLAGTVLSTYSATHDSKAVLENVTTDVEITGGNGSSLLYVGGLAGRVYVQTGSTDYAQLLGCTAIGDISITQTAADAQAGLQVGGLVGYHDISNNVADQERIERCAFSGSITVDGAGTAYAGGLVGYQNDRSSTSILVNNAVTGDLAVTSATAHVGGLVGLTTESGWMGNSFFSGSITVDAGTPYVGGLIGSSSSATALYNLYANGAVTVTGNDSAYAPGGVLGKGSALGSNLYWTAELEAAASGASSAGLLNASRQASITAVLMNSAAALGADYGAKTWEETHGVVAPTGGAAVPPADTLAITVSPSKNGTAALIGTAAAKAGETVSVSAKPASSSYMLSALTWSATDTGTHGETATDLILSEATGYYQFTMPAYPVTLTATFDPVPKFSVTLDTSTGCSMTARSFIAGTTNTATVVVPADWLLDYGSTKVKTVSGKDVAFTSAGTSGVRFTMPAEDVVIYPAVVPRSTATVTVDRNAQKYLSLTTGEYPIGVNQAYTVTQPANGAILAVKAVTEDGTVTYCSPISGNLNVSEAMTLSLVTTATAAWTDEGHYDARLYAQAPGNWYVYDAADLAALAKKVNDGSDFSGHTVTLMADIDLDDGFGTRWSPIGSSSKRFAGTFDGGGHTVSGMKVEGTYASVGLFGSLGTCSIRDLTVEGSMTLYQTVITSAGGLAGELTVSSDDSAIANCLAAVEITVLPGTSAHTLYAGGLIGQSRSGSSTIRNSGAAGHITVSGLSASQGGKKYVGGLIGSGKTAENCWSLTGIDAEHATAGGLFGTAAAAQRSALYYSADGVAGAAGSGDVDAVTVTTQGKAQTTLVVGNTTYKDPDLDVALNLWVGRQEDDYATWTAGGGHPVFTRRSSSGQTYPITLDVTGLDHGDVNVPDRAAAGDRVSVYAVVSNGFSVRNATYTVDGVTADLFSTGNGGYYFYMPAAPVSVAITIDYDVYALTTEVVGSGALAVSVDGQPVTEALAGAVVTVKAAPETGSMLAPDSLTAVDDQGGSVALTQTDAVTFTFTMPRRAVTLSARFTASNTTNADGTLKPGTYTVAYQQGMGTAVGSISGPMGGPVVEGEMTLTVAEDGSITANYRLSGLLAVGMYFGLGQLYLLDGQVTDTNGDGIVDVVDYNASQSTGEDGELIAVNFKPVEVLNWGNVDAASGENSLYEGTVTASADGTVYTGEDGRTVAPRDIQVDVPAYIKNDGLNNEFFIATYENNAMHRWAVMKYLLDFSTLVRIGGDDPGPGEGLEAGTYELPLAPYSASSNGQPGGRGPLPMGGDTLVTPAALVVDEDGVRTLTIQLTNTYVAGLYGHLSSLLVYYGDTVQGTYENLSSLTPAAPAMDGWYSATVSSEAMTPFNGTPVKMTRGSDVYYTSDGVEAKFDGKDANLVYPGSVTFVLPDYISGDTASYGNELYIRAFIDAMGSAINMKLVLDAGVLTNGKPSGGGEDPEKPPLEDLIAAVTEAKLLQESDHTPESWAPFAKALADAQALITASSEDSEAIAAALKALTDAKTALVRSAETVTFEELKGKIAAAESLQQSDYTTASWGKLSTALTAAKGVTEQSAQADLAAAYNALASAISGLVKSGGGGSGGGGSSGGGSAIDPTKTGTYKVPLYIYAVDADEENMGDGVFANNREAIVKVSGGTATLEFATNPINKSGVLSAVTAMQYSTDGGKSYQKVEVLDTAELDISDTSYKPSDGSTLPDSITYISHAKLVLEEPGAAYVYVKFTVPYTPMDAITGEDASEEGMSARIFLDWDEAEKTDSGSSLDPDTSTSSGTSSITGKDVEDVEQTDKATGITLSTTTERVSDKAEFKVEVLTKGTSYDTAVKALGDEAAKYKIYSLTLTEKDEETDPDGAVTLRFPVEEGGSLKIYRISPKGVKTLLTGELSKDKKHYEITTSTLGIFAVSVEEAPSAAAALSFDDVPADHWAAASIASVVEKGLFQGQSSTQFDPSGTVTRAMLFTVLHRMSGESAEDTGETWWSAALAWAVEEGISDGTDPTRAITREQMAAMLYRYSGSPADTGSLTAFADAGSVSTWARDAMGWAVAQGIVTGKSQGGSQTEPGPLLDPAGTATRAELAVMLDRLLSKAAQ